MDGPKKSSQYPIKGEEMSQLESTYSQVVWIGGLLIMREGV